MKKILMIFIAAAILSFASCNDMYDNVNEYATTESIYPGAFDQAKGYIGFERIEINLLKAGRLPSSKISLGTAKYTVIEYNDRTQVIDSLCSWVNIIGLTEQRIYRFKIYTMDDDGNKSISQEVALIPYTKYDREALFVLPPQVSSYDNSNGAATLIWERNIASSLFNFHGLIYSYTDKNGNLITNANTNARPALQLDNLAPGQIVNVDLKYKVTPKPGNIPILDAIWVNKTFVFAMPD